jgi:hypothetical protein
VVDLLKLEALKRRASFAVRLPFYIVVAFIMILPVYWRVTHTNQGNFIPEKSIPIHEISSSQAACGARLSTAKARLAWA